MISKILYIKRSSCRHAQVLLIPHKEEQSPVKLNIETARLRKKKKKDYTRQLNISFQENDFNIMLTCILKKQERKT